MAQRSVVRAVAFLSATTGENVAKILGYKVPRKQQSQNRKRNNTNHVAVSRSAGRAGKGDLFLEQLNQGLVGNAESTHVSVKRWSNVAT